MEQSRLLRFAAHSDERGQLVVAEGLPFAVQRVFWIGGVPAGETRGAHALRQGRQCVVALAGSCMVTVDDGRDRKAYWLDRPTKGLLVPAGLWRTLSQFSRDAIVAVLAELPYDESDYIRDYDSFLRARACASS